MVVEHIQDCYGRAVGYPSSEWSHCANEAAYQRLVEYAERELGRPESKRDDGLKFLRLTRGKGLLRA